MTNLPPFDPDEQGAPSPDALEALPLLTHLVEFRQRLVTAMIAIGLGFILCYIFAPQLYAFLVKPLAEAEAGHAHRLIYTGLTEAFTTYLKLALWGGVLVAFPVIVSQIWAFIAPGLYKNERRAILPFLIAAPVLFLAGAAMAYYLVFPMAWRFFLSFEVPAAVGVMPIEMEARVSEYLSLSMTIIMAFGLSFQLPVVLVLLARAGVVSPAQLVQFRRYAIVLIFAIAAVLTPPDVISQISLAVPLCLLYETAIWGARWVRRGEGAAKPLK